MLAERGQTAPAEQLVQGNLVFRVPCLFVFLSAGVSFPDGRLASDFFSQIMLIHVGLNQITP